VQLRELIEHRSNGPASGSSIDLADDVDTTAEPFRRPVEDDAASTATKATFYSIRSVRSTNRTMLPSFTDDLKNSRPYKRVQLWRVGLDHHSSSSFTSSTGKGGSWSMLSEMSLGDLSISEISVFQLPINISDLWDKSPYERFPMAPSRLQPSGSLQSNWSSRGRLLGSKSKIPDGENQISSSAVDKRYMKPFFDAFRSKNAVNISQLLSAGVVDAKWDDGYMTGLQYAAAMGDESIVEQLLEKGANVNAEPVGKRGRTALQGASEGGHLGVVIRLLKKGANVNAGPARIKGRTALQGASERGHVEVVNRLLEKGANVNAEPENGGRTALQGASEGGHLEVVNRLLEKGANVNAGPMGRSGRTALQGASEGGHLEVVNRLLEKGANVNAGPARIKGRTALQGASEGGHLEVVDVLLEKGANVNAKPATDYGRTALQGASDGGHLEVVDRLLEKGANVNAEPAIFQGRTALQGASEAGHHGIEELLRRAGAVR